MIDIYNGHRTEFLVCEFWSVVGDSFIPPDQICYETKPSGIFYAKEITPYTSENQEIEGSYMLEQKSVTLQTRDNVGVLKRNDIVKFNDELYRVERVQKVPVKKHRQFLTTPSNFYYVSLRG